jgi:16S rRNA processing protein RimM
MSDRPDRFAIGSEFAVEHPALRRLRIRTVRPYRDRGLIVGFEGIDDRDAAEGLRGTMLTIGATERRPLDAGEFWVEDLVGLEVVDPEGTVLGRVVAVVLGPQDRLQVETFGGRTVEVPFVDAIVGDPREGRLPVDPPAGMFDDV